jgi:hypothetical protein
MEGRNERKERNSLQTELRLAAGRSVDIDRDIVSTYSTTCAFHVESISWLV